MANERGRCLGDEGGDEGRDREQDDPGPHRVPDGSAVVDPVQGEGGNGGVGERERPERGAEGQPAVHGDQPELDDDGERGEAAERQGDGVNPARVMAR